MGKEEYYTDADLLSIEAVLAGQDMDDIVYGEEAVPLRPRSVSSKLPQPLKEARLLAVDNPGLSRRELFLKQATLLADYKDKYKYICSPCRFYPTYQSLTDKELRAYFSWRTRIRNDEFEDTPLTFILLYLYELINLVGVPNAAEGYERLLIILRTYGTEDNNLKTFIKHWLRDFSIYYNLPPELLAEEDQVIFDQCFATLENVDAVPQDKVIEAIKQLVPNALERSKFYSSHFEVMDTVIYNVLKRFKDHYGKNCKRSMMEQFFGSARTDHYYMFSQAMFCDPLKRDNYEYAVDDKWIYRCRNGVWSVSYQDITRRGLRKLRDLLKTIDMSMREEFQFGSPLKAGVSVKWQLEVIREEARAIRAGQAQKAPPKIEIDFSKLGRIRNEAAITQEKLVEPELEEMEDAPAIEQGIDSGLRQREGQLTQVEKRLLQDLLAGEDLSWVREEGYLLSVLVDAINDKLYEIFGDSVMSDEPRLLDEYVPDLKEMITA